MLASAPGQFGRRLMRRRRVALPDLEQLRSRDSDVRRATTNLAGGDNATRTSSSSNPPSQHQWVSSRRCLVRIARVTYRQVMTDWTACSSALNLRKTPNAFVAHRLQRMLGGENHETRFCACRSRRSRWCRVVHRSGISPADRRCSLPAISATNGAIAGTAINDGGYYHPHYWGGYGWHRHWGGGWGWHIGIIGTTGIIGTSGEIRERGFGPFLFSADARRE